MTLFPIIQPQVHEAYEARTRLELYKEVKWDLGRNIPVFKNGSPVIVSGKEAVLVWAWKALHTPRFRYEIYTWNYGNEVEALIGQPYTEEVKQSEAARYVRECLLVNPYITDVSDINVSFEGETLRINCRIQTIYGEVGLNV